MNKDRQAKLQAIYDDLEDQLSTFVSEIERIASRISDIRDAESDDADALPPVDDDDDNPALEAADAILDHLEEAASSLDSMVMSNDITEALTHLEKVL